MTTCPTCHTKWTHSETEDECPRCYMQRYAAMCYHFEHNFYPRLPAGVQRVLVNTAMWLMPQLERGILTLDDHFTQQGYENYPVDRFVSEWRLSTLVPATAYEAREAEHG
jgi:hypothetical protein